MTVADIVDAVENLPTDPAELDALAEQITSAYEEIAAEAGDDPTDEQVDQIEALADALSKVKAAKADAAAAAESEAYASEDRRARAAAAAEAFAADEAVEEPAADEAADDADADAEGDGEEFAAADTVEEAPAEGAADDAAAEDDAEAAADDDTDDGEEYAVEDTDDAAEGDADTHEKEMTVNQSRFAGKARGTKAPAAAKPESPFRLDPADRNYQSGSVSLQALADAFNNMTQKGAIRSLSNGASTSAHFGYIDRGMSRDLIADENNARNVLDTATDEAQLSEGSLVAAGGWCAPSETVYDFLPSTAPYGLFSLPEIGISRGGLRFPVEPDFSVLYDSSRGSFTEAESIAGVTKQCFEIPCADMQEVRLDAIYTCVTTDNLARVGWPELTAKFLAEAVKGHAHRLSALRLAKARELSEAVTPGVPTLGTAGSVLNALELHAEDIRLKYRLGDGVTIEGVAPLWLRPVLRADLAYREGVLPSDVTNAQIDAWFSQRGVRFQWVADYQTDVIGSGAAGLTYPEAVEVLLYPAGTFFSALEPVLNLGVTYDSTGISRNQRTELFVEDGWAVGKRGYESRALTIPVDVNGSVGLREAVTAAVVTPAAGDEEGEG